jgi:hypothetical protein
MTLIQLVPSSASGGGHPLFAHVLALRGADSSLSVTAAHLPVRVQLASDAYFSLSLSLILEADIGFEDPSRRRTCAPALHAERQAGAGTGPASLRRVLSVRPKAQPSRYGARSRPLR